MMKKMEDIKMKRRISALAAFVLVVSFSVQSIFAAGQGSEAITTKADLLVGVYGATSVQYALIEDGEITVSGQSGVYDKTESAPLTSESMYGIGSVSKVYTAAAVMKLVDEGKVELDKPVTDYVPDFKMADARYKKITVRMLLNHSSGLMGSSLGNAFLLGDNDTQAHDNLLVHLSGQNLKAEPGAFSVYCNDGFTLAEIVVERVSGVTFTQYLAENIAAPLGLTNTKTPQDLFNRTRLSKVYYPTIENDLPEDTANVIGTGGIYSTAEELCLFAQIFMTGQTDNPLPQILSKESVLATMEKEYARGFAPENTTMTYGLGWDNVSLEPFEGYGIKALSKGGDTILSHGSLVVLPEYNMAAAVLSSGGASTYDQMLAQSLLLEALIRKGVLPENATDSILGADGTIGEIILPEDENTFSDREQQVAEDREKYVGYYGMATGVMKVDIDETGTLRITVPGVEDYEEVYVFAGEGTYTDETGLVKIAFIEESNGKIYMEVSGPAILPGLGEMYSSQYNAQKLEANPLSGSVAEAWQQREGKNYYIVNEKYSSQVYLSNMVLNIQQVPGLPGYIGSSRIADENHTRMVLQIPTAMGRDLTEYSFFEKDGVEYLQDRTYLAVEEDQVVEIYGGKASTLTIKEDGYARWLKAGNIAGKTMKVDMPKNASVAIFDQQGTCVDFSWASGNREFVIPEEALLVFAGDPGVQFGIELQ